MKDRKKKAPLKEDTQPIKYYSLTEILKRNAHYNVIFGERSNGKTYAVLLYALKKFVEVDKSFFAIYTIKMPQKRRRVRNFAHVFNINCKQKLTLI